MRRFVFSLFAAVLVSSMAAAQPRPETLPGNNYIYPSGTTAYYQGNGRSNFYEMPQVLRGVDYQRFMEEARRRQMSPRDLWRYAYNRGYDPRMFQQNYYYGPMP